MASDTTNMGRNIELTETQVLEIMESGSRPVWSASQIAETAGVSRATATKRLKKLAEAQKVETAQVGNATAYYLVGITTQPVGDGEEPIKRDLRRSFENRFVGKEYGPWRASHPDRHPATAGDKVQCLVSGVPGDWELIWTRYAGECDGCDSLYCSDPRKELSAEESSPDKVTALLSGTLYAKPTVPIEHIDYPDDYEFDSKIPTKVVKRDGEEVLVASGVYWRIRPCDDAVFLTDVEIVDMSGFGEGEEIELSESDARGSLESVFAGEEVGPKRLPEKLQEKGRQELDEEAKAEKAEGEAMFDGLGDNE